MRLRRSVRSRRREEQEVHVHHLSSPKGTVCVTRAHLASCWSLSLWLSLAWSFSHSTRLTAALLGPKTRAQGRKGGKDGFLRGGEGGGRGSSSPPYNSLPEGKGEDEGVVLALKHNSNKSNPTTAAESVAANKTIVSAAAAKGPNYIPPTARDNAALQVWEARIAPFTLAVAAQAAQLSRQWSGPCAVLDVGANVGTFPRQFLQLRPDCFVYAFEPVADLYSYMFDRYAGYPNVVVENLALCESTHTAKIYKNMTSGNRGWNTMEERIANGTPMRQEAIECITFDEYVATRKGPLTAPLRFAKIDVEGFEWSVLRGMHNQLQATQWQELPFLAVEIGFGYAKHPRWGEEVAEFEWLFQHGYRRFDYQVATTTEMLIMPAMAPGSQQQQPPQR